MPQNLLLDTCAVLFTAGNKPLHPEARQAIDEASGNGSLFMSPVSAWEFGLLMLRGQLKSTFSAIAFFEEFVMHSSSAICELTPAILANSSFLPNFPSRDPADCLLITTARTLGMTLVTRDTRDYGRTGVALLDPWMREKR